MDDFNEWQLSLTFLDAGLSAALVVMGGEHLAGLRQGEDLPPAGRGESRQQANTQTYRHAVQTRSMTDNIIQFYVSTSP